MSLIRHVALSGCATNILHFYAAFFHFVTPLRLEPCYVQRIFYNFWLESNETTRLNCLAAAAAALDSKCAYQETFC